MQQPEPTCEPIHLSHFPSLNEFWPWIPQYHPEQAVVFILEPTPPAGPDSCCCLWLPDVDTGVRVKSRIRAKGT